jgi:selenide,water dikinase
MRPLRGVRVTLVSREPLTPYSGMLPGYVAGHYGYDDIHVDLGPLTTAAGVRFIVAEAVHVDLRARCVEFDRHPPLRFDLVSLNCGAAPGFGAMAAPACAIPVKPIGRFIPRWRQLLDALRTQTGDEPFRVTVVGGGAGGVELALSVHTRSPRLRLRFASSWSQPGRICWTATRVVCRHASRRCFWLGVSMC